MIRVQVEGYLRAGKIAALAIDKYSYWRKFNYFS